MNPESAARQLHDALDAGVVNDLMTLGWWDLADAARERLAATAQRLAAQISQDEDDRLAAQTVIDLAGVAWEIDPPAEWWRTPLGRLVARSVGRDDSEAVTQSVAAAMLGVTRGTIAQLVARGTLDRHPEGGVSRASVLKRIVARGSDADDGKRPAASDGLSRPIARTDVRGR